MTPYTYRLSWTKLNIHYFGAKFSKNADPNMFWVNYFTSSKYVKQFIAEHGEPDIKRVTRVFNTKDGALKWESKFLTKVKANKNPNFINRSNGFGDTHNYKDGFSKPKTQSKANDTLIKKYGARGSASQIIKDNVEKTCMSRYGVHHTLDLDHVKQAREKANLKKYGHKNPFASKKFYEMHENPMHNEKHRLHHKQVMQNKDWTERDNITKQRNLEKYGVEYYYQSQEFRDKMNKLKRPCPYGCRDNHKFDKGNFTNHMVKCHKWTKEKVKEYNENQIS